MSAAQRQTRRRQRKRDGDVVLKTIVLRARSRDVLVDGRWVQEWDESNVEALTHAVQMLLDGLQLSRRDASN